MLGKLQELTRVDINLINYLLRISEVVFFMQLFKSSSLLHYMKFMFLSSDQNIVNVVCLC